MQTHLLWTGQAYHSLENCLVSTSDAGVEITATIIGAYGNHIYKTSYCIQTDPEWRTLFCEITSQLANSSETITLEGDGKGHWLSNGKSVVDVEGCVDIDISLTPFTNSLPINRLHLEENESRLIDVVYFDVLAQQMKPVQQRYTRLSRTLYQYQNVPDDFEARIEVDDLGLVVDYPSLFARTAYLRTSHP